MPILRCGLAGATLAGCAHRPPAGAPVQSLAPRRGDDAPTMLDRLRRGLALATAAYLALLPSNALSFWRSLAFACAALLAAAVVGASLRGRAAPIPGPGRAVVAALGAWSAWACASLAWSIDPAFTVAELKSDVAWGLVGALACYVAVAGGHGRTVAAAVLGALAFWPALAVGLALSPAGWNARLAHMGVVAYSTYLVTVAPLLMLVVWTPPVGLRDGRHAPAVALALFALVVATARMSDNRIVWLALAAGLVVLVTAWRPALPRGRTAALTLAAVVGFGVLAADALRERAHAVYSPQTSIGETLERDPRLAIWRHAAERYAARPLTGYGYGRLILKDELREDTGDRLLTHAHNMFMSQALQTGAVGVALLVALLAALAARYAGVVRSGDAPLRRLGALGLAVLAAFVVKNLTDDFFFRANLKLFLAVHALLLGLAVTRERALRAARGG